MIIIKCLIILIMLIKLKNIIINNKNKIIIILLVFKIKLFTIKMFVFVNSILFKMYKIIYYNYLSSIL